MDPRMQAAIAGFREALVSQHAGIEFDPSLDTSPPHLAGTYRSGAGGMSVAGSPGTDVGAQLIGSEFTITEMDDLTTGGRWVSMDGSQVVATSGPGVCFVRGSENHYTLYSCSDQTCIENGSDYVRTFISVATGSVDAETGNLVDRMAVSVVVGTAGELTDVCAARLPGLDRPGAWEAQLRAIAHRVD